MPVNDELRCTYGKRTYSPDIKLFISVGWGRSFLSVAWPIVAQMVFFFAPGFSKLFGAQGSPSSDSLLNLWSPRFLFIRVVIMICLSLMIH